MRKHEDAQDIARTILNAPMIGSRTLAKFEARTGLAIYVLQLAAGSCSYTGGGLCELAEHATFHDAISKTLWSCITTFAEAY